MELKNRDDIVKYLAKRASTLIDHFESLTLSDGWTELSIKTKNAKYKVFLDCEENEPNSKYLRTYRSTIIDDGFEGFICSSAIRTMLYIVNGNSSYDISILNFKFLEGMVTYKSNEPYTNIIRSMNINYRKYRHEALIKEFTTKLKVAGFTTLGDKVGDYLRYEIIEDDSKVEEYRARWLDTMGFELTLDEDDELYLNMIGSVHDNGLYLENILDHDSIINIIILYDILELIDNKRDDINGFEVASNKMHLLFKDLIRSL